MTEEEKLAEEYTKINALKGLSYRQITETYDEISGYPYFLEDKIKQAFLAGLKAGRPKWHDVAGGDLPKDDDFVCNQDGMPCWFDIETDQWLDCEGTQIRTTEWCEMPKFEV